MSPEKPRFSFPLASKNFRHFFRNEGGKKSLPGNVSIKVVDGDIVLTPIPTQEIKQEEEKKEANQGK